MLVTILYEGNDYSKPIEYTFNLIFTTLGIDYEIFPYSDVSKDHIDDRELSISYGNKGIETKARRHIHIYQSRLFGPEYKNPDSMPILPLRIWDGLPIIYEGNGDIPDIFTKNNGLIETNIDLVASCFFMVSRYEEIISDKRDEYKRFLAKYSVAYKEKFLTIPIVNEYIEMLWKWINDFGLPIKRRTLWNGKTLAVLLTHDVDKIKRYQWYRPPIKLAASLAWKSKRVKLASKHILDWLFCSLKIKADPYWNFDYITDIEQKNFLTSSFYFCAGGATKYDTQYQLKSPKVANLIKKLESMDHEVGLHGSFNSYNDFETFIREKSELDSLISNLCYGNRQHYLNWETPDTWKILEKAGILYDTTLGYADHEGFRCGFCLPFKPFDVIENRILDLWEIPLIVMEDTLKRYRSLTPEEAYSSVVSLLDIISNYHGLFVMLWHNSHLYELQFPGWRNIYELLMKEIGSRDIFVATGRDIIQHWEHI